MPRGMSWRRFSMATIQRFLCQTGRTVAACHADALRVAPDPRAAAGHVARRFVLHNSRACPALRGRRGTSAEARGSPWVRGLPWGTNRSTAHGPRTRRGARTRPCGRTGRGIGEESADRQGTPGPTGSGARRRVSGGRGERSRAASRTRRAAAAWRCAMSGDATRAASTGPRCRLRGRPRDGAAAGASGRRGGKDGASRAGRRREERPPTASLFAVR